MNDSPAIVADLLLIALFVGYSWGLYRLGRRAERRKMRDKPITDKQRAFILSLCRERDHPIPDFEGMTVA